MDSEKCATCKTFPCQHGNCMCNPCIICHRPPMAAGAHAGTTILDLERQSKVALIKSDPDKYLAIYACCHRGVLHHRHSLRRLPVDLRHPERTQLQNTGGEK